jgi:hypothetical protein
MAQALDLFLNLQFTAFEFHDFQVIDRGMGQAIGDFVFERLMTFLKFREVRLQRHAVCLLNQCLPEHPSLAQIRAPGDGILRPRPDKRGAEAFGMIVVSQALNAVVENVIIVSLMER